MELKKPRIYFSKPCFHPVCPRLPYAMTVICGIDLKRLSLITKRSDQVGAPHCAERFDSMNGHTVSNDLGSMNSWTRE